MNVNRLLRLAALGTAGLLIAPSVVRADEFIDDDRPRGTYVMVDAPDALSNGDDIEVHGGGEPHILFINRCEGGTTLYAGNEDSRSNSSTILQINGIGSATMPPFPYGDAAWDDMMQRTRSIFSPFNILVTDVDPGDVPHDEAMVCGSSSDVGMGPNVGGVAPYNCGIIPNAITFTFPENLGNDPQLLAEVVGQEAAHAWGLDHEFLCEDPMTYLSGCGPKSFQDIDAPCGEFSARACQCGGNSQNSYQIIMGIFGPSMPDDQAPDAQITYPGDGDVFAPGDSFDITVNVTDDTEVRSVSLYVDGALHDTDDSAPYGPWPVSNIPEGTYELYVEADDPAGNITTSQVVTFHVTPDGGPPPGDEGGDGNGDDEPGGDGGLDGGDEGGDEEGAYDDGAGGALPPDFGNEGLGPNAPQQGCTCTTGESGGVGFGLLFMFGLLGLRVGGRRRD